MLWSGINPWRFGTARASFTSSRVKTKGCWERSQVLKPVLGLVLGPVLGLVLDRSEHRSQTGAATGFGASGSPERAKTGHRAFGCVFQVQKNHHGFPSLHSSCIPRRRLGREAEGRRIQRNNKTSKQESKRERNKHTQARKHTTHKHKHTRTHNDTNPQTHN